MEGLIVTNGFRLMKATEYKIKRLMEEFSLRGISLDVRTTLELSISIKDSQVIIPGIEKYSFCVFLDKDENIAAMLETRLPLINSAAAIGACNDKLETYIRLAGSGIMTPKTIPARLCFRSEESKQSQIDSFVGMVGKELGFPLICKNCYGSLGLQVYLLKDKDELRAKYEELLLIPHLYQRFVSCSAGHDFRIFTIGGKAVAYMERINPSDFRSNIALGGKGYAVRPPDGFIETAEKASRILGLDYAGVDILLGENNAPLLSEVNSNAFFSEIEAVSGINLTGLLADHIISKISR